MSKFNVLEIKIKKRKRSSQCLTTQGEQQAFNMSGREEKVRREGWGVKKEKRRGEEWEGIRIGSTQVLGSKVFPKPLGCEV